MENTGLRERRISDILQYIIRLFDKHHLTSVTGSIILGVYVPSRSGRALLMIFPEFDVGWIYAKSGNLTKDAKLVRYRTGLEIMPIVILQLSHISYDRNNKTS